MANSLELDQDELAHNEPSHLDPHCLLSSTHSNSESDYVSYSKADHHGMERLESNLYQALSPARLICTCSKEML